MAQQKVIGVLGFPLTHSQSPELFQSFFEEASITDWTYTKFEFDSLTSFMEYLLRHPEIKGFNVTIPYKIEILRYLDEIDSKAQKIGAVNTVVVHRNGQNMKLQGTNTDYYGFKETLLSLESTFEQAVILGTGGSSKAVSAVLTDMDIPHIFISRHPKNEKEREYLTVDLSKPKTLLVNTTPVGMKNYPHQDVPINLNHAYPDLKAIDLIYNPAETPFLQKCYKKGITCVNGGLMLRTQARYAWNYFKNSP